MLLLLPGALTYTVAASEENRNTPRGLLGNFNGNPNDDFITPDGTQIPISSDLRIIHYQFGMTWKVSQSESLFTYPPGRNHSSFQNPSFVPSFDMPSPNDVSPDARAMCGNSKICLFDVKSTGGNVAFANNTVKQERRVKEIVEILNTPVQLCPKLTLSIYAVLETSNGFFDSSVATLLCVGDSYLQGNNRTTCSKGSWTSALGDCVPFVPDTPPPNTSPPNTPPPNTPPNTPIASSTSDPDGDTEFNLFKPPFLYAFIGVLAVVVVVIAVPVIIIIVRKVNSKKVGAA